MRPRRRKCVEKEECTKSFIQKSKSKIYANAISCYCIFYSKKFFGSCFETEKVMCCFVCTIVCICDMRIQKTHHSHPGQVLNSIASEISSFWESRKVCSFVSVVYSKIRWCVEKISENVWTHFFLEFSMRFGLSICATLCVTCVMWKLLHSFCVSEKYFTYLAMLFILFCNCLLGMPYSGLNSRK